MAVMLDKKGLIVSLIMAVLVLAFGGWGYLALLLTFLGTSVLATRYGEDEKKELGIYEYERSWENVISNGIVPVLLVVFHSAIGPLPFITSVAAITADKFASELGVLEKRKPIFLFTLKPVAPGTSGAVSAMGTVMSLAGAIFIGGAAVVFLGVKPTTAIAIGFGGFVGCLADSIAGIPEEMGIGNKYTSNLICSIVGGAIGFFLQS